MDFSFSRKEVSLAVTKTQLCMIQGLFEQVCKRSQDLRKRTDLVNKESAVIVAK